MIRRTKILLFFSMAFILAFFVSYSNSQAQIATTNDLQQFLAMNSNLNFQDFSAADAPDFGTIGPCSSPVNSNSNDICFSPGDILPDIQITDGPTPGAFLVAGEDLFNFDNNPPNVLTDETTANSVINIEFNPEISAVGLTLGCFGLVAGCNSTITVEVFGAGNVLLGTTNVNATSSINSFIGIVAQEAITNISLSDNNIDATMGILDIRFGEAGATRNVPTLSEWGLITMAVILGTVGFIIVRRRQVTA
ncbi:MAG: IPTL-CTERM sorting domain-containing protein [Thermodesulfobacteriota bacterium]